VVDKKFLRSIHIAPRIGCSSITLSHGSRRLFEVAPAELLKNFFTPVPHVNQMAMRLLNGAAAFCIPPASIQKAAVDQLTLGILLRKPVEFLLSSLQGKCKRQLMLPDPSIRKSRIAMLTSFLDCKNRAAQGIGHFLFKTNMMIMTGQKPKTKAEPQACRNNPQCLTYKNTFLPFASSHEAKKSSRISKDLSAHLP
jgi:hypothetical protein